MVRKRCGARTRGMVEVALVSLVLLPGCSDDGGDTIISGPILAESYVDSVNHAADLASLDIMAGQGARTSNGGWWIQANMVGAWPPPETFWSYFVSTTVFDGTGAPLMRCVLQRHEGQRQVFCSVGSLQNLDLRERRGPSGQGPIFHFINLPAAARFQMETGVAPLPTSGITRDQLEGNIGVVVLPPPAGN